MELISIVVPVYNIAEYLSECIESIMSQTYRNIEIIIVDDGSTDGTSELCDELSLQDSRIVVIHQTNGGVSSARNCGIDTARGQYITFIDGDDWVEKNYIEVLYNSIKKGDADISAVGFIYQYPNGEEKILNITEKSVLIRATEALNQVCDPIRPWVGYACGKLVRKDILKNNGIRFDTSVKICEDSLFWCTVFEQSETVVKNKEAMYNYRIRETSATRSASKSLTLMRTRISAFEKALIIAERHSGTPFQTRVQTALFSNIISYISAMFSLNQYDKDEINVIKSKLRQMKTPQIIKSLEKGVRIRTHIFMISPRLLFLLERAKEKVQR